MKFSWIFVKFREIFAEKSFDCLLDEYTSISFKIMSIKYVKIVLNPYDNFFLLWNFREIREFLAKCRESNVSWNVWQKIFVNREIKPREKAVSNVNFSWQTFHDPSLTFTSRTLLVNAHYGLFWIAYWMQIQRNVSKKYSLYKR